MALRGKRRDFYRHTGVFLIVEIVCVFFQPITSWPLPLAFRRYLASAMRSNIERVIAFSVPTAVYSLIILVLEYNRRKIFLGAWYAPARAAKCIQVLVLVAAARYELPAAV